MRIFGSVKELFQVVWRKNGKEVTLEPAEPTVSTTITIPNPGDAADTVVLNDTAATLTNKTLTSPVLNTSISGTALNTDLAATAETTKVPTAAATKTYADSVASTAASALNDHLIDTVDAHDASAISYVNATSGLAATQVQAAIDEVEGRLDTAETNISNKQPLDGDLTALAGLSTTGLIVRTADSAATTRSIAVGSNKLSISNDSGVTGNPTLDVAEANLSLNNIGGILGTDKGGTGQNSSATFPTSGTVVTRDAAETLTNKILTQPQIGGAKLTDASKAITANSFGLDANVVTYRINSGTGPLNTITGAADGQWVVLVNELGSDLTITNNSDAEGFLTGTNADLVLADDAALTLIFDSGSSRWNVVGGAGAGGGLKTVFTTASVSLAANNTHYLVNSSGGARSITLPDSPQPGAIVRVSDEQGTSATNNITVIAGAGDTIDGNANFILDVDNGWAQFMWNSATNDWTVDTLAVAATGGILSLNGQLGTSNPVQTFSSTDGSITFNSASGNHDIELADTIAGARTFSSVATLSQDSLGNILENLVLSNQAGGTNEGMAIRFLSGGTSNGVTLVGQRDGSQGGAFIVKTSTTYNAAPTEKFRIDDAGNVGIGTSTPPERLTVAASTSVHAQFGQQGVTPNGTEIRVRLQSRNTANTENRNFEFGVSADTGNAILYAPATSTPVIEAIKLAPTGAVTLGPTAGFSGVLTHKANGAIQIFGSIPSSAYAANSVIIDNNSGQSRFFAIGPDAATRGTYEFRITSSDNSLPAIAGSIATTTAWTIGGTGNTANHRINGTTTTTATTGTAGAPPAQVRGYLSININGVDVKIPYYNL